MDDGVGDWFASYLSVFAACGRGERPVEDVVGFYSCPLLLTADDVVAWLSTPAEVAGWVQGQIDGMRAAGYADSVVLDSAITPLNGRTALFRGAFSRRRSDGSEISALTVSYLITGSAEDRRISAMVLHSS